MNPGVDQLKADMKNLQVESPKRSATRRIFGLKKARDSTIQGDLMNKLMGDITRFSLGGISAVGRTKVDKRITAQEHTEVLMVFFHLEQILGLHDEQMKEKVPIEIANELVKLRKNQKKTFPMTMVEQMLSKTHCPADITSIEIAVHQSLSSVFITPDLPICHCCQHVSHQGFISLFFRRH